jgi:AcrR family transcriptional regulator
MQVKKDEIRALIIRHALDEFELNGYSGTQMRTIANKAQTSIGNIYRYFTNKDDLFDAIVQPVYMKVSALIFDLYKNDPVSLANISLITQRVSHGIMQVYAKHGRELMVLVDKNKGSRYENFIKTLVNMVNERLKQEIPLSDDPSQILTFIISSGFVEGLFIVLRKYKDPIIAQKIIQRMILFYFNDIHKRLELGK